MGTVTENRVESKLTMEVDLGAAGRRLSSAATLEEKKSELTLSFRKGMADQLSVPLANIQVTETKFKAIPGVARCKSRLASTSLFLQARVWTVSNRAWATLRMELPRWTSSRRCSRTRWRPLA